MFGLKGYLIIGAIMLTITGGFYWYYKDSQAKIELLTQNNAKLEVAIQTSEAAIASLQENYAAANTEIKKINEEFIAVRAQNRELIDKLSEHEIGYLASRKPVLVQNVINKATNNAMRCFELLSGATLTNAERNAKDGKTFNSECPWLFDTLPR